MTVLSPSELSSVFSKAEAAGHEAATAHAPTPMTVVQKASPMDDSSPTVKEWHVPEGVCGFAWIVITPGTSREAKFAKKYHGASKHYYGGVSIWVGDYGQSMERKEKYARAFAGVLKEAGIKAYADSRMD
jgi:hypothetical protein